MKEPMRLYEKMTPKELAITAFSCHLNDDEDGFKQIMSKVPRKTYSETHHEWQDTLRYLKEIGLMYAWCYWELRAYRAERLGLVLGACYKASRPYDLNDEAPFAAHVKADEDIGIFGEEFKVYGAELLSLHQAFEEFCQAINYPLEEIRRLSGVTKFPIREVDALPDRVKAYKDLFYNVING